MTAPVPPPPLIDTGALEPANKHRFKRLRRLVRTFGDYRLYLSIAAALLMACVTIAMVALVFQTGSDHDEKVTLNNRVTFLQKQVGDLTHTVRDQGAALRAVNQRASATRAATACRARLANAVSDAQADATLSIGDLAVALYFKDGVKAQAAADAYSWYSQAYKDAVKARGDSVAACGS